MNQIDQSVVIDNGTFTLKAGFAGFEKPTVEIRTLISSEKYQKFSHIGNQAQAIKDIAQLEYPIKNGYIIDWDNMEKIWEHTFVDELKISSQNCSVLLTEPPLNPKINREKMIEIMFEKFNLAQTYVVAQPFLSLYASNRTTGLVLESGDSFSHLMPIYEGFPLVSGISRFNIGGSGLTNYLHELLKEHGYELENETVRDIKEKFCYVAFDFDDENLSSKSIEKFYELPDGKTITINDKRFKCPEALFQPSFMSIDSLGIHETTYNSIMKSDIDLRRELYSNIVISGGTSLFSGFSDRIEKELKKLAPNKVKVKITSMKDRKYSVWIGGSILASLSTFQPMWITKKEYEEIGPSIVNKKCP